METLGLARDQQLSAGRAGKRITVVLCLASKNPKPNQNKKQKQTSELQIHREILLKGVSWR